MKRLFKNIVKIFIYNLLNFLPIFFYSIISSFKIYNKFSNYKKIIVVKSPAIGAVSTNIIFSIIYIKKNNLKRKDVIILTNLNEKFDFLLQRYKHIFDIKYDNEILNLLQKSNYKILFSKKILYPPDEFSINKTYHNFLDKFNYRPELSINDIKLSKKILFKLGLSINDKIILINNRSSYFSLKENKSIEKQKIDESRNSNFSTLSLSIEYLNNLGFKIVRIGDYEKDPKNCNYISLLNLTENEKKLALIYLPSIAKFAIAPDSGITCFLSLYKLPILIHNLITIDRPPINFIGIFLPKKKFIKNKKFKPISFREHEATSDYFFMEKENSLLRYHLQRIKLSSVFHIPMLDHFNIELIENNKNEILECVREFLEFLNDKQNFINKFKISEKNFIKLIKKKYIYHSPKLTFFSKNFIDKYDFFRG